MELEIQDTAIYSMLFADGELFTAQDYGVLEYMTRKLTFWCRNNCFKF